jgi:hypothetical protein
LGFALAEGLVGETEVWIDALVDHGGSGREWLEFFQPVD